MRPRRLYKRETNNNVDNIRVSESFRCIGTLNTVESKFELWDEKYNSRNIPSLTFYESVLKNVQQYYGNDIISHHQVTSNNDGSLSIKNNYANKDVSTVEGRAIERVPQYKESCMREYTLYSDLITIQLLR